ncbi:MAG: Lrp/AsnC family transcriptional regulator [Candidatus Thermoplasmatota archaeon]|nr:Lrp/AsnC family transcriptional regulator [Candidatus Thermoplasmatota archaeon]
MDGKDLRIIEELKENGRESTTRIAGKLNMPRVTVHERIKRLVEERVIKRFTVQLDYHKLGLSTTAFVLVSFSSTTGKTQSELAEEIARIPNVFEVHIISGEWDLVVKARAGSVEELGDLVVNRLRLLKGVEKTISCFSFRGVKEEV